MTPKIYALLFFLIITTGLASAGDDIAKVVELNGSAKIRYGKAVKVGDPISWGSELIVAADSHVIFASGDFSTKVWGPASLVIAKPVGKSHSLSLLFGRLIAAFVSGSNASVSTRSAVAGVRGTVVYAEDSIEAPDYHCLCEGSVEYSHRSSGRKQRLHSKHHDHALHAAADTLMPDKMKNHDDGDVAAVKRWLKKP